MPADVIYGVDFRAKKINRAKAIEQMAAEIIAPYVDTAPSEMIPYGGAGIDGMLTDKEPA